MTDRLFDPDALREKYRQERERRLRPDGNEQYVEVKGRFAQYLDDPYVASGFTRAPLTDEVEVIVIGGGFGGLLAGARLRQAGVENLRNQITGPDFPEMRRFQHLDGQVRQHRDQWQQYQHQGER
jgi:cyclohexanone monooxygenase